MIAFFNGSLSIAAQTLAMRHDAAVCELEGPLITGPIISLKMLKLLFIESLGFSSGNNFHFK
jgi:hypothetical protein